MMYEERLVIKSSDVDCNKNLKTSSLLRMSQEASIADTEQLGVGRKLTLDRGILWVLTRISFKLVRLPIYDETIIIKSYPGITLHTIFPRYYNIETENGTTLALGSALWVLIDAATRKVVFPDEKGIIINGLNFSDQLNLPGAISSQSTLRHVKRIVAFSDLDLNGHMNNTKYADWTDDLNNQDFHNSHRLISFQINYISEAVEGENITMNISDNSTDLFVLGSYHKKRVFELKEGFEQFR